ncbi:protein rapunzel-like [Megalops cyprinoides]|uniref:protein rapunzel-like n=1 Tax=Megalops cyprinoides TaxID=118141 RepID=UPI0018644335|nr:protein rapunzel-like [Megalops cyprinoides]
MADKEQLKKTAVKVLCCVEKVSSFASSINPLFGIVTSLVAVVRKGLVSEEDHAVANDFCELHKKLESISENNQKILRQIQFNEVQENYGKYEQFMKHQYEAFNNMVGRIKIDPEDKDRHINDFIDIYERDESDNSLEVYYQSVMGIASVFGRPILEVYLKHCNSNHKDMEHMCLHLTHLFHIGLIAFMAYTVVTENEKEVERVKQKWSRQIAEIQAKMEETLSKCTN